MEYALSCLVLFNQNEVMVDFIINQRDEVKSAHRIQENYLYKGDYFECYKRGF
jgi:hypothetical protein